MKQISILTITLLFSFSAQAQNHATKAPITMEQLMSELRIKGGNWSFTFEKPVLAYVVFEISSYPDGTEKEVTKFISDEPKKEIEVFFSHSAFRVGDYPNPKVHNKNKMLIQISNCKATAGTRVIHYSDKFMNQPFNQQAGQEGDFRPSIAEQPELNHEYVLAYYYKEGDPYEVKATISFIEKESDITKIKKFDRHKGVRDWKEAGEE
jgi:hypothetical protein